jgi:hypothetical protein
MSFPNARTQYANIPRDPRREQAEQVLRGRIQDSFKDPKNWSEDGFEDYVRYDPQWMDQQSLTRIVSELTSLHYTCTLTTIDDSDFHDPPHDVPVLAIAFVPDVETKQAKIGGIVGGD